jgi:hypothetical protein
MTRDSDGTRSAETRSGSGPSGLPSAGRRHRTERFAMTIETNNVADRLRAVRCSPKFNDWPPADSEPFDLAVEAADLIQSLSDRIDVLEVTGNTLAETVKLIKHVLVASLTKRELEIVMGDLHAWNVASLTQGGKND